MNLVTLVDQYLFEVSRLYEDTTERKYHQTLAFLLRDLGERTPIEEITERDVVMALSRWKHRSKTTRYLNDTIYRNLFKFAVQKKHLIVSPMEHLDRPKRPRPEDVEVVAITTEEVAEMFSACKNWGDEVCLGVLAYTGSRRNAVSMIRWKDVDLREDPPYGPYGWIKLREKGGKYAEKPIPFLLRQILDRAPVHDQEDYLVPNKRPAAVKRKERSNTIIYNRVKGIAERAGVRAHVHAIRAAFAVTFLEANRGNIKGLQDLLGHTNIQTTQTYLRKFGKKESMAGVVDLTYGALNGAGGGSLDTEAGRREAPAGETPAPLSALSERGRAGVSLEDGPHGDTELAHSCPPNREAAYPLSLSALSEGETVKLHGDATEYEHSQGRPQGLSPSESATSRTGGADEAAHASEYPVPSMPEEEILHRQTRTNGEGNTSVAIMTRQESDAPSQEPENGLLAEVGEAHTGFEPVLRGQLSIHRLSTGARHVARHGRPCYSRS